MADVKRQRWTEEELDGFTFDEQPNAERKSGALFNDQDQGEFLATLGKALSAFANSGGGHIFLGVANDGTPDGLPPSKGATPLKEWLEQRVPNLVNYPLQDFRVHVVERSASSRIPPDKQVMVIDVGDSALAPHQCVRSGKGIARFTYFYRVGGRSEPAPHFYLEMLRQRLIGPQLKATLIETTISKARRVENDVFLHLKVQFLVENIGQVAAYHWRIQELGVSNLPDGRGLDYRFNVASFPAEFRHRVIKIGEENIMLPAVRRMDEHDLGVYLHPISLGDSPLVEELTTMVLSPALHFRVLTETAIGEEQNAQLNITDVSREV